MKKELKTTVVSSILLSWLCIHAAFASSDVRKFQQEVVDRIVALVNEEVITLTDVKIVKTFRLYSSEDESEEDYDINNVLKKLIDQHLVIQLTGDDTTLLNDTVEEFIDGVIVEMGVEEFRRQLEHFGMTRLDLMPYASRCIAYQRIVADRFRTAAAVSLKEIEEHYERTYIPEQRAKGLDPQPMLEILDEIEAVIKIEKSQMQIEGWLEYLRERADIQVNM